MLKNWKKVYQSLRNKTWFRLVANRYVIVSVAFAFWMGFLDIHSCQVHREIDTEIAEIEESIEYYQTEIKRDEEALFQLQSQDEMLEKFAREQFLLRKPNEEIYLIEVKP
ncbi:MAG: septum formation initiator family protein [Cryomorphaceae bacterium]|nr:septum formation initiator family protein [Cryomorphaceae bacterium]